MFPVQRKSGFSLIEINLAIFVISIGMLTLFSLFPAGLRQVEDSHAGTQEALFADYVLSTIRADSRFVDLANWVVLNDFVDAVMVGLQADEGIEANAGVERIEFGAGDQFMRYELEITEEGKSRRVIRLWCKAQEFGPTGGDFRNLATKFYTEVMYSGMP